MSIASMTGYASASRELPTHSLTLELRAVNHRYLELQFRMPEEFRYLETALRERLASRFTRGKMECRLNCQSIANSSATLELSWGLVEQLQAIDRKIRDDSPHATPLSVGEILRWPGVVQAAPTDAETLANAVHELLGQAIDDFEAARLREGERLVHYLLERVERMEELVQSVAPKIPALVSSHQERLAQRLQDALGSADAERLKQEVVLFAQKIDIDEELGRLNAHLAEVRRILKKGGAAGKRLDFMMQELNREANTLGSKSVSTETTGVSMELKVLIEQMREQVQNIE